MLDQIATISGTHVIKTPTEGIVTLYFNLQSGLTTDRSVRRAIALAVDTDGVVRRATRGAFGSDGALRGQFGADAQPQPP